MAIFIFNDLSIEKFFNDFDSIKKSLKELSSFYIIGTKNGYTIYIFTKRITDILICNIPFRKAINDTKHISTDEKRVLMRIIDKSSPVFPEDSAIPEDFTFFYDEKAIPKTGLAECAYLQMMEEIVSAYSLSGSHFRFDNLKILISHNKNNYTEIIRNYFSLTIFEKNTIINSWDNFIDYIEAEFEYIILIDSAKRLLKRETFETALANTLINRISVLNKMVNTENTEDFLEMHKKYCQGSEAWFSDESDTRKNDPVLKNKFTFMINGLNILCSYHGKVRHRDFRIHISSQPKKGEKIYIAYIGGKIL